MGVRTGFRRRKRRPRPSDEIGGTLAQNVHGDPLSGSRLAPRLIYATAPIRIADNGGWTDTWVARRGKVFNIAVRPLVEVRIDVSPVGTRDARLVINAENYGMRYAAVLDGSGWGPRTGGQEWSGYGPPSAV